MKKQHHNDAGAPDSRSQLVCLNHLRRGQPYVATMRNGDTTQGIYLGIETAHGDRSILLARPNDTRSIGVGRIATVEQFPIAC
jgi:hypothetical protein